MAGFVSIIQIVLKLIVAVTAIVTLLFWVMGGISHLLRLGAKPSFEMIKINQERRLHTVCEGPEDAPFVLYDAGAFGIYTDGWWVMKALKDDHRVCLYDRAGMGWSDPIPTDIQPNPDWHVEDIRRLRKALGSDEPFILIGHSMAGIRLHAYANAYPDELAGLIFIDAARPQNIPIERVETFVPWLSRALSVTAMSARLGLAGGIAYLLPDELNLPQTLAKDKRRSIAAVSHHKTSRLEMLAAVSAWYDASWRSETRAVNLPTYVFSKSPNGGANADVATRAKTLNGLGGVTALPTETHVSLLNQSNANLIAQSVREITQRLAND